MKQILQNLKTGSTEISEVPAPLIEDGKLLIRTSRSLVSAGTERMLVDFGKANLLNKARQQPDKVRMVLDKVRTDGLAPTLSAVKSKLDQPLALGYCNVGVVAEIGAGVHQFSVGDRVISNGHHAEVVCVPQNLCASVPDGVSDESAAFTVLGAVALQGIRLVAPTLGECVVVTGLGLIGLLTVQLLVAHGCRVLGIDFDDKRLALAQGFGAETVDLSKGEDPRIAASSFSKGQGVDAVLITASTKSNEPVSQAANMCRKRGRIVLVGISGLELSRADFFEKELTFQVSCSYGPGRYDDNYEQKGRDYPIGFVRWTERRNFEAVLGVMASGRMELELLISHRFSMDEAEKAYTLLASDDPSLGILLEYGNAALTQSHAADERIVCLECPSQRTSNVSIGVIGAGNYAGRVLLPAFQNAGAKLTTIVSKGGVSGVHYGKKHGFSSAATDPQTVFDDNEISSVVVVTRHDSHADYVLKALHANKHVFVEKPLCLTIDDLDEIEKSIKSRPTLNLMVGFNRRFSPLVVKMKALLATEIRPKSLIMTVNAGDIPGDHWTQDLSVGGGRIVGEACHFVDLLRFLVGATIDGYSVTSLRCEDGSMITSDKASIILNFADGSVGVIHYLANGHKSFPKERLDVFSGNRILQLDNFRALSGWGWKGFSKMRLWSQDKGQDACAVAFVESIRTGSPCPISIKEILEVSRVSIEMQKALS